MRLSPAGAVLSARPYLGRIKRGVVRRRFEWSPSGAPNAELDRPAGATAATRAFLAARALERFGRTDAAVSSYAESLDSDGRYERRWIRYGSLLASTGRTTEAIGAFRSAHECRPGSFRPLLAIASLQLGLDLDLDDPGRTAGHIEHLAAERDLSDPQFEFLLALVRRQNGDASGARSSFRRALDADDPRPERIIEYARFEAEQAHWDDAVRAYMEATSSDDDEVGPERPLRPEEVAAELQLDAPRDAHDGWATVATGARILLSRDPDHHDGQRALGFALAGLAQWSDAVDALTSAAEHAPRDVDVLDRLAQAATQAGEHEVAIDARRRSVVESPTGRRFQSLAISLERAGRYEEAVSAFEHAIRLGQPVADATRRFGAAQRRSGSWSGAALLYRWALDRHPDIGYLWYYLGVSLEETGEFDEALAAYQRALDLEPDNARYWFRLGYLHERHGPMRTVAVPWTGLQQQPVGALPRAVEHYRRAIELDPTDAGHLKRLAGVLEVLGDLDEARDTIERAITIEPTDPTSWHVLGRVIAAKANQRAMYHPDEHDELERIWGEAIRLAPRRSASRQQLVRSSIKASRWHLAEQLAWYPTPPSADASAERILRGYARGDDESADELERVLCEPPDRLMWVPREWWFPLHWKLLSDNRFTLAYRAKRLMAERTLHDGPGDPTQNLGGYLDHARALSYLGRNQEALDALTASLTDDLPDQVRRTLDRHAADISLLLGEPRPHLEIEPTGLDPHVRVAEEAFDELIRGRRIAIVGPGHSELGSGREIDDHDVVIRTKFVDRRSDEGVEFAGARTDVSYYALSSAQFLRSDISDALRSGALQMAVFRTSTYSSTPTHLVRPGDLRYVPSDFVAGFRATQFAIQRIFYDVLRYSPAEIKVFNINFFLSPESYRPGYNGDLDALAGARGYIKVLGSYGHDFLADFAFTQAMYGYGLLDVDPDIENILRLTPEEYLHALDRRG